MQAAKKLMLVDPQLKVDREYKQIQKPGDSVVKTNLSLNIAKTINNDTLSDDQKVKRYLQTLNRYYQVTDTEREEDSTVVGAILQRRSWTDGYASTDSWRWRRDEQGIGQKVAAYASESRRRHNGAFAC